MKVKVLRPFISGRVSGEKGDIIENISESKAKRLATLGLVEIADESEKDITDPPADPQTDETDPDGKKTAEKEGSTKSDKSGGKAGGKK